MRVLVSQVWLLLGSLSDLLRSSPVDHVEQERLPCQDVARKAQAGCRLTLSRVKISPTAANPIEMDMALVYLGAWFDV